MSPLPFNVSTPSERHFLNFTLVVRSREIADLALATKVKGRNFDIRTILPFALVCLCGRVLLGRPNYLCSPRITSRKEVPLVLANRTILRLGEFTQEGLIGKTKLPLLLRVSLKGKRLLYFDEPYFSQAW